MIGQLNQRIRGHDLDVRACPCGFGAAGCGADQAFLPRIRPDRGRQHARNRRNRAVEAELAEHGEAGERIGGNCANRGHQAERNRQIIMAAFLRQIGGCEIDGDAARGQRETGGDQG